MSDPLSVLRGYSALAPMSLRVLVSLSAAILERSTIRPLSSAATLHPTERTIRYYVASKLMSPPDGKGPAAAYSYRHLLQVLFIKLRQMEGATLETIGAEQGRETGDVLERRVAAALGEQLPAPADLEWSSSGADPGGRAGRALGGRAKPGGEEPAPETLGAPRRWTRVPVGPGAELHLAEDHPAMRDRDLLRKAADLLRRLLASE